VRPLQAYCGEGKTEVAREIMFRRLLMMIFGMTEEDLEKPVVSAFEQVPQQPQTESEPYRPQVTIHHQYMSGGWWYTLPITYDIVIDPLTNETIYVPQMTWAEKFARKMEAKASGRIEEE
jgi:hypothetical protein